MYNNFTDIAAEIYSKTKGNIPNGVKIETTTNNNINITQVDILKSGLNREKGKYITIETANMALLNPYNEEYIKAISKQIRKFLPKNNDKVLVVGIGNRAVAPDSLGPLTADKIFVTEGKHNFGIPLREVACVTPGVSGATGINTSRHLHAISMLFSPCCIILIDSICTSEPGRLGACVQISNTGLTKKDGEVLNQSTLGVPVIAIGVPTIMQIKTAKGEYISMCPKDINAINESAACLLALCVNKALQNELSIEELAYIVS